MNKTLFIYLGFIVTHISVAQSVQLKIPIDEENKSKLIELSKDLFTPFIEFEYQFSTSDLAEDLDSISTEEKYDINFLNNTKTAIEKKPKSAILWNQLGNYYNSNGQSQLAQESFQRALNLIDLDDFNENPSLYHSLKGLLMYNLGVTGYIDEFEQAIEINPNDTISTSLFPFALLSLQEYERAQTHCLNNFHKFNDNSKSVWFMILELSLFYRQFLDIQKSIWVDSTKTLSDLRTTNVSNLFDFSIADKLANENPNNKQIKNCQLMIELMLLCTKLSFSEQGLNPDAVFTKDDKKRILAIKNELIDTKKVSSMNEFSRLKNLAVVFFCLNELDLSESYFKQSIEIFPESKTDEYFNIKTSKNGLLMIWDLKKNYQELTNFYLSEVVQDTSINPNISNYNNLSKCYYQLNDFENAHKWSYEAYKLSPSNFDANRLMAHHHFINDKASRIDFALKNASSNIENEDDARLLYLQYAIYSIAYNRPSESYQMLENARSLEGYKSCKLCDQIEAEYLQKNK